VRAKFSELHLWAVTTGNSKSFGSTPRVWSDVNCNPVIHLDFPTRFIFTLSTSRKGREHEAFFLWVCPSFPRPDHLSLLLRVLVVNSHSLFMKKTPCVVQRVRHVIFACEKNGSTFLLVSQAYTDIQRCGTATRRIVSRHTNHTLVLLIFFNSLPVTSFQQ
jgi:hypothetical protein